MRVYAKNVEQFRNRKDLVNGIARNGDGTVYIEYYSDSGRKLKLLKAFRHPSGSVEAEHLCEAVKNERPCWHLGAVVSIFGLPTTATVISKMEEPPVPAGQLQDVTPFYLERKGRFDILNVNSEAVPEAPSEPIPELPPEDAWLEKYFLPAKLLKKLLSFREKQKQALTEEQRSRVPNAGYIPTGNEVVYAVASLLYGEEGEAWEAPLLIGPKGSGKSTLAETLAAMLMLPVNKIFGGIDVNAEALLGSKTLVPAEGIDVITE
ncbi:MAG: AAA family ATPase, partial [Firmicutes bacterium]|nr:AAA family ATPase [Bacillota bacterium]